MNPTRKKWIALSTLACLIWVAPARAEEESGTPSPGAGSSAEELPTIEEAREAFLRGRSLIAQGKWTDAEEQFLFSVRVKNTPGLRYYIGFCREKEGLLEEALSSYRLAAELLETQKAPDVDQIVPVAIERVIALLPVVMLSDVPPGASLKVDGALRPFSEQFHANPGSHRVLIEKEGYTPFATTVDLVEGQKARIQVKMEPLDLESEGDAGDEPAAHSSSQQLRKILFWSSAGVAVAGLGAGVTGAVLFSSTKRKIDDLNEEADKISGGGGNACSNPTPSLERICEDLARGAKRKNAMGNLMIGGFVGAGVGALGAVVTHYFWPEAPVRVQVGLSRGEASFLLGGEF